VLVVVPKGTGLLLPANFANFAIRLLTAIPRKTFPAEKLKASKNNLRSAASTAGKKGHEDWEASLLPTPHYNASILEVDIATADPSPPPLFILSTEGWG